jgi:glycosyltransferase involved in cell wall biosynthesis
MPMREACLKSESLQPLLAPSTSGARCACAGEAAGEFSSSWKPECAAPIAENPPLESGVRIALLIPAYQPSPALIDLVQTLCDGKWEAIVVVDDGSGPEYTWLFKKIAELPKVKIIPHAVNLGKGSALKTGINAILCAYPGLAGIVTADADGQHDPADIRQVASRFQESPEALVLGVRSFKGTVPLRSRVGNEITRLIMRAVVGQSLTDTQTGLRVIPRTLLAKLLTVSSSGYEFELEMLIAVKHLRIELIEQPIRTIYESGNRSSHFQPLRDSMRIYFVLLRFALISLTTAALDNVVFYVLFHMTGNILESQVGARCAAVLFQYPCVRRAVFISNERHRILLPRYLLLVAANAALSYAGIELLTRVALLGVFPAKIAVETILFIANFAIQRDFVFTRYPGSPTVPVVSPTPSYPFDAAELQGARRIPRE